MNYVYADPKGCNCLYVGSQKAYDQRRQDQLQERLADERPLAAPTYADLNWD